MTLITLQPTLVFHQIFHLHPHIYAFGGAAQNVFKVLFKKQIYKVSPTPKASFKKLGTLAVPHHPFKQRLKQLQTYPIKKNSYCLHAVGLSVSIGVFFEVVQYRIWYQTKGNVQVSSGSDRA